MGISKETISSLAVLRQGIEELSSMPTSAQLLRHALKLSLSLTGASKGFIMLRTSDNKWAIHEEAPSDETSMSLFTKDDAKGIQVPDHIIEMLLRKDYISTEDGELSHFIPNEFNVAINRIVPIKGEGMLKALLLIGGKNDGGIDDFQAAYLSILAQYVSILLSNIRLREEMREMTGHYEDIIEKKETAEKLASLGTIAAGLAHEIKNPLVSIKTLAQLLPERFDDPEFRDHFTNIAINEVDRINSIVYDLLNFAKSSEPKVEPLDMVRLIEDILLMLSSQFTKKGVTVQKRFTGHPPVIYGDYFQLKQVLLNILINSMEAMPQGGEITVEVMRGKDMTYGERVIVTIGDTGFGIREEDKTHLFEPFFTTKGAGTGLGLSICKRILEKHQGEISIESAYNKGAIVTLILPVKKGES